MTRRSLLSVSLALAGLLAGCGEPPKVVPPSMELSATALDFAASVGAGAPAAQVVDINHLGGGRLSAPGVQVSYQQGSGWLTDLSVGGGPEVFKLTVRPNPGSLAKGTYHATIRVSSVSAANSPLSVAVTLVVADGLAVTRQLASWGEDGTAASAAATDVTTVTLLDDDGAGGTRHTDLTSSGAGTWRGPAPVGAWSVEVAWKDGHRSYIPGPAGGLSLDLGEDLGGRAGRAATTLATPVTPDLTGLDEWGGPSGILLDGLYFHGWGAQGLAYLDQSVTPGLPLFGFETALDGTGASFSFDWRDAAGATLDPADVLRVLQVRPDQKTLGAAAVLEYQHVVAWGSATALAMVDGQPLTVAAALAPPDPLQDGHLTLGWQRSAFEEAIPPYASVGSFTGHEVGVWAMPAPLTATAPLGAVALPLLRCIDPAQVNTDFSGGDLPYARFLPAAWREFTLARFGRSVARRAPGATANLAGAQDLVYRYDAAASAPPTFVPLVGAPTAPTVDGQDALAGPLLTGVSRTATLAWQPPATGTPTSYRVAVLQLTASGTASVATLVADFVVDAGTTSLTLPAELAGSTTYLATIAARSSPTDAGGATPFRTGVPFGEGLLWTVPFTTVP